MIYYTCFESPFCDLTLAGTPKGVTRLFLHSGQEQTPFQRPSTWQENSHVLINFVQQLQEYFGGNRQEFTIPIVLEGTDFQKKVWQELQKIPYGEVRSYKDIARAIGNEKAARAVGVANNKNPIPIIIPCHRVIGSNGSLTGFAHGVVLKRRLLAHEGFVLTP